MPGASKVRHAPHPAAPLHPISPSVPSADLTQRIQDMVGVVRCGIQVTSGGSCQCSRHCLVL